MFRNGSMIMLVSGTEAPTTVTRSTGGRSTRRWAQRDATIEQALKPAMITRPAAQLFVCRARRATRTSAYFDGKMDEGRARCEMGVTGASAYIGYSRAG